MKEPEMAVVAKLIGRALDQPTNDAALEKVRGEVKELTRSFPLYLSRLRKV
jgi:glycine hydroxymethyltransferase